VSTRWLPFELHPDTPAHGAPKPFTDAQWPAIEQRLRTLARQVGVPIEPPRRNANSRLALETGELVRARAGNGASATFHHAISRAFFVDGADIADVRVVAELAGQFGIGEADVREAWASHAYAPAIDASMRDARAAGVTGVPAYGWPESRATSGMMEPHRIVAVLNALRRGA
jgi:predicted DsbA family dithiol-disulfide isomerase